MNVSEAINKLQQIREYESNIKLAQLKIDSLGATRRKLIDELQEQFGKPIDLVMEFFDSLEDDPSAAV